MKGMLFDVAVLGSELSGLIAGSLLVKRGYNVLMVEVTDQALAILADLCYIDSPENKKLGRVFGTLTRDF